LRPGPARIKDATPAAGPGEEIDGGPTIQDRDWHKVDS